MLPIIWCSFMVRGLARSAWSYVVALAFTAAAALVACAHMRAVKFVAAGSGGRCGLGYFP